MAFKHTQTLFNQCFSFSLYFQSFPIFSYNWWCRWCIYKSAYRFHIDVNYILWRQVDLKYVIASSRKLPTQMALPSDKFKFISVNVIQVCLFEYNQHCMTSYFIPFVNRNEKFADVMLFASNSEGGVGIPAHKLILSSCSHVCF